MDLTTLNNSALKCESNLGGVIKPHEENQTRCIAKSMTTRDEISCLQTVGIQESHA